MQVKEDILAGKSREEILAVPEIRGTDQWKDPSGFVRVILDAAHAELSVGA